MAAKSSSMSASIRDYLAKHPDASNKEVIAGLKAMGVKVKDALISNVKWTDKKNSKVTASARRKGQSSSAGRQKAGTGSASGTAAARPDAGRVTMEELLEAKHLVSKLGGIEQARQALEALRQLQ